MKFGKRLWQLCVALILVMAMSIGTLNVAALSEESVPYDTYTYWDMYGSKTAVKSKATYEVSGKITGSSLGTKAFSDLQYIFSANDRLYILDSGNSRVVVLDRQMNIVEEIQDIVYAGEKLDFTGAKGLYVDDSGLYIADTEHERVIHITDGIVTHVLTRPDDPSIPDTFAFTPSRLVRDESGYIYLLCDGSYYGMMVFSNSYEFFGFFGANNVKTSFGSALKNAITSLFDTETKHSSSIKSLPFSLLDLCVDSDGFIVAINGETSGQMRRFGFSGTNTLVKKGEFLNKSSDSYNFADNPVIFKDKDNQFDSWYQSKFRAITADAEGFYYLVDDTNGKIFIYDTACNCLSVFGGGRQKGYQVGSFISPSAIAIFEDKLLVSDFSTGEITVFVRTEFGKQLMQADKLSLKNDYENAKPLWEDILRQDEGCQLAYKGLAKAALKEKDYSKAMEYAKVAVDRETYAAAYEQVRNDFLLNHFAWIALAVVALVSGLVAFVVVGRKKQIVIIKNQTLKTALGTPFHPLDNMQNVKYKGQGSFLIATVILILFYISSVVVKLRVNFMFSTVSLSNFNSLLLLLGTVGVVAIWTISNWLVCILFEGKGKMRDIYCVSCYCLIPLIAYNLIYLVFSNVLIPSATSPFELIHSICYLYTAILLLLMITVIHEFSFFKAIATALVTVLGMAIVAFVLFSMLTLWQDMLSFIIGLFNEVTLR